MDRLARRPVAQADDASDQEGGQEGGGPGQHAEALAERHQARLVHLLAADQQQAILGPGLPHGGEVGIGDALPGVDPAHLDAFLPQFYLGGQVERDIPPDIILAEEPEEAEWLVEALTEKRGGAVRLRVYGAAGMDSGQVARLMAVREL